MDYLIAADGPDLEAKVSKRFGHAPVLLRVNPETGEFHPVHGTLEELPNHGVRRFEPSEVEAVITGNIGPHAFEDVRDMGWKVYVVRGVTVREAIRRVRSGEVQPAEKPSMKHSIHEGQHRDDDPPQTPEHPGDPFPGGHGSGPGGGFGPGGGQGHGPGGGMGHGPGGGRGRGMGRGGGFGGGRGGGGRGR